MDPSQFQPPIPGRLVETTDAFGNAGHAFVPDPIPTDLDLGIRAIRLALSQAD
jgi:hypothetical protein